jgi:CheY-like chemotaxis protein
MVLDLHMPRLDGWSVLRTLQGNLRHRELPVILLSAHDGDVDALKAARAGARAYLKKSGHARDLLASAELLTRPRRELEQRLKAGEPCTVESASVGVCWLLATLGEAHRTGVLELEDQLGRYELRVRSGEVEGVAAQQGSLRSMGATAFDALVASRGSGLFTPQEPSRASGGVWLSTMLSESAHRRTERSRQALRELASRPERLVVNDELSSLFGRSASVDELNVLSALRERRGLGAVSEASGVPAEDVEDIVHHLLWRGVVALAVED